MKRIPCRGGAIAQLTLAIIAATALLAPTQAFAQACAAAWSSTQVYTAGNTASESGINYVANWWTQGNNPATNNGGNGSGEPWTSQGACGGSTCSAVPSAPTGLSASGTTTTGTSLSWSAVTPPANCTISSYTIYKGGTSIGTSTGTTFSVTGLSASTTYSFTVAATDSDGTGSQSSSVSVTTPSGSCTSTPSAPGGLAASGTTSSGTNLSWNAVTPPTNCSISSYTIFKGGSSIGTSSGTSFSVTGLSPSTSYSFTVAATDSDGAGSQSSSVSVTTTSASCTSTPAAPGGLAASGTTGSSTTLSWNAVTPPTNCSISGYTVYLGGSALATVSSGTSYTASGLNASTTYSFTVAATDADGTGSQSSSVSVTTTGTNSCSAGQWSSTAVYTGGMQAVYNGYLWQALYWTQGNTPEGGSSSPWNCMGYCGALPGPASTRRSMPYVDVTLTAPYSNMSYSVSPYYTMAFVTDGGSCTPAWNGKDVSSNPDGLSALQALRAAGGDASLSFGGQSNSELATTCSSISTLQAAYQSVITQYSLKQIDFDIEGGAVGNTSANDNRAKAIVGLQSANPGLKVTFTLPVETYGFDTGPMALLQDAVSDGVKIYAINGMSMDFGGSYDHGGEMYLDQQLSAWSMMSQIQTLYPSLSHAQVAAMTSITPMIGENDLSTEVFQLSDASNTVSFAEQQGIGEMGFWAESRDSQCTSGETNYLCSNVTQSPSEYASIFDGFNF